MRPRIAILAFVEFAVRRRSATTAALLLLTSFTACTSSNTTLDDASAKRMLTDALRSKGDDHLLPLGSITQQIQSQTREDYVSGTYSEADSRAQVQRLLKAGYIKQTREDINYKNVTGSYKAELPGCGSGLLSYRNRIHTFTLSMQPSYSTVSGEYTFDAWYSSGQKAETFRGPVRGEVSPDGLLMLIFGPMSTRVTYKIDSEGNTINLIGPTLFTCSGEQMTLSGTGTGGFLTVPRFSYVFSDNMKQLLDASNNLRAGKMKMVRICLTHHPHGGMMAGGCGAFGTL